MTDIIRVNPKVPDPKDIEKAASYLLAGDVVAYPTETIYGLGVDVFNKKAVKKLYDIKARDYGLPVSILVANASMLKEVVTEIPERAHVLMRRFWPGSLTILFEVNEAFPKTLVTNTGKVGVRISSHPIASALVSKVGRPITTTSANKTGFPPSLHVRHIQKFFENKLACIVDGGECEPSRGSTVVDVTEETMRIIRDGAVPADEVIRCFQRA
ncbi:MAG: threonylcarbamoyl-AMP synthase [Deltaproteobacteria bacterium RIFCSPLOWO2_12_FULL_44_12]|nr:MAG: threonylcarbamoyl-AMP synthase [Deltaproteobacteria bacterium RIFCSPHIGHO2_01_FULL_43_49]OGQ16424.1 MAG: threonylcarbamoyl-AMP synthase [Deltaproteobacteria bacterium RIFCSPHIGHO2_02_FULL_44_53]OGQ27749.1 MAG: threonylcarbamoyl-AMP synthase [Deltaproteobacteria bacterium RIFCSPHIGHO2_12_FULL_44_21]OGQ32942.1 MAG: threonylcarbamoyl-AMP synthase [Deltaproteobacteria bacterium RIFCSPLOWO2_01_FULL_45_74]OGQ42044.1 MAG: threonylcarbamoyl-AMP synthase [Deltaproteobacteria bacterium RIFCSPLOWO